MPSPSERISKLLSLILRHRPQDFGVQLDIAGWTDIDRLLQVLAGRGVALSQAELFELVRTSDKQRFAISEDGRRIRANQGHSVVVDLAFDPRVPPPSLFHGTVARFLPSIRSKGLLRGNRHHVHLSVDREQAARVGERRGPPIVLEVHAGEMATAGHRFFCSPNGVWLVDHVPPQFILFPG